jgi:hypothetical protein
MTTRTIRKVQFKRYCRAYARSNICCFSGSHKHIEYFFSPNQVYAFLVFEIDGPVPAYDLAIVNDRLNTVHPDYIHNVPASEFYFIDNPRQAVYMYSRYPFINH